MIGGSPHCMAVQIHDHSQSAQEDHFNSKTHVQTTGIQNFLNVQQKREMTYLLTPRRGR